MSSPYDKYPALVEQIDDNYKLEITVTQAHGVSARVGVPPPSALINDAGGGLWPGYCFQALLIASEYCVALQEFLRWAFPPDWDSLKPAVAQHAASFISTAAAVPPPALPTSPEATTALLAHAVWAAFTHCYFHGARDLNVASQQPPSAGHWLRRLVGDQGWRTGGPVYSAAAAWVRRMRERLGPLFPGLERMAAQDWQRAGLGGAARQVEARRVGSRQEERYHPVYPYRVTGGFGGNRIKFKCKSQDAPREVSAVKGKCGVPHEFSQTHNCALGFLLLSDVMQAFSEASKRWEGLGDEAEDVIQSFFNGIMKSDTAPLRPDHLPYEYPAYMAGCALGWELALQQVATWVAAAADTAAVAFGYTAAGDGQVPIRLIMPCDAMAMLVAGTLCHPQQQHSQQHQQQHTLYPPPPQAQQHMQQLEQPNHHSTTYQQQQQQRQRQRQRQEQQQLEQQQLMVGGVQNHLAAVHQFDTEHHPEPLQQQPSPQASWLIAQQHHHHHHQLQQAPQHPRPHAPMQMLPSGHQLQSHQQHQQHQHHQQYQQQQPTSSAADAAGAGPSASPGGSFTRPTGLAQEPPLLSAGAPFGGPLTLPGSFTSAGGSGTSALSPFLAMQQQQQQRNVITTAPSTASPTPGPPPLSPLISPPSPPPPLPSTAPQPAPLPLLPPPPPPPYPNHPQPPAPQQDQPAEDVVNSISNMSLDPFIPFGDATLDQLVPFGDATLAAIEQDIARDPAMSALSAAVATALHPTTDAATSAAAGPSAGPGPGASPHAPRVSQSEGIPAAASVAPPSPLPLGAAVAANDLVHPPASTHPATANAAALPGTLCAPSHRIITTTTGPSAVRSTHTAHLVPVLGPEPQPQHTRVPPLSFSTIVEAAAPAPSAAQPAREDGVGGGGSAAEEVRLVQQLQGACDGLRALLEGPPGQIANPRLLALQQAVHSALLAYFTDVAAQARGGQQTAPGVDGPFGSDGRLFGGEGLLAEVMQFAGNAVPFVKAEPVTAGPLGPPGDGAPHFMTPDSGTAAPVSRPPDGGTLLVPGQLRHTAGSNSSLSSAGGSLSVPGLVPGAFGAATLRAPTAPSPLAPPPACSPPASYPANGIPAVLPDCAPPHAGGPGGSGGGEPHGAVLAEGRRGQQGVSTPGEANREPAASSPGQVAASSVHPGVAPPADQQAAAAHTGGLGADDGVGMVVLGGGGEAGSRSGSLLGPMGLTLDGEGSQGGGNSIMSWTCGGASSLQLDLAQALDSPMGSCRGLYSPPGAAAGAAGLGALGPGEEGA